MQSHSLSLVRFFLVPLAAASAFALHSGETVLGGLFPLGGDGAGWVLERAYTRCVEAEEWDRAEGYLSAAPQDTPEQRLAVAFARAELYCLRGHMEAAARALVLLGERDILSRTDALVVARAGWQLCRMGRLEAGIPLFERYLAAPEELRDPFIDDWVWYCLAEARWRRGDGDGALEALEVLLGRYLLWGAHGAGETYGMDQPPSARRSVVLRDDDGVVVDRVDGEPFVCQNVMIRVFLLRARIERARGRVEEAERNCRLALSHYLSCECPFVDDLYWEAAGLLGAICRETGRARLGALWEKVAASGVVPEWQWDAGWDEAPPVPDERTGEKED